MKTKSYLIILALLISHGSIGLADPLGTAFTYQGKLTDGGIPAQGIYDLRFTVYAAASDGTLVAGPITNSPTGVTNGLFTTTLDFGANVFTGSARWLEIGVRTNGGGEFSLLSPRQPLTPAPYALYAPSAGVAASATVADSTAADSVSTASLQANSVTTDKIVNGTITDAKVSAGGISGDKIMGGDLQAQRLKVGANHTLSGDLATIAGGFQNTISNAAWSVDSIGGGQENRIDRAGSATIAGGTQNTISNGAWAAAIGGGQNNRIASATHAAIGGGQQNTIADGAWGATVPGGAGNRIQSNSVLATIAGGNANTIQASSGFAAIGGGSQNTLGPDSWAAVVSGGEGNRASASHSVIGGGYFNSNTAWAGTIPGGRSNVVTGALGFAAGNRAKANHQGSFVWGDSTDADVASTAENQFLIRASGGVGIGTNNPQSALHVVGTVTATAFIGDASQLTGATPPPGMVLIPAGPFTMGNSIAADTDITNATPIPVTVSAFYMDVKEVTWSQWQSVYYWAVDHGYGFNAGAGKAANHPVQTVNWYDCVKWCNARSEQVGKTPVYYTDEGLTAVYRTGQVPVYAKWAAKGCRLPTEAEWEKAARGGLSGQRFPWGNLINQNLANYHGNASLAYDLGPNGYHPIGDYPTNSPGTSPVESFAANGYGLYDMAGNVQEWCWDWYGTPYAGGSDPRGPASGSGRVLRGGDWGSGAYGCRAAFRYGIGPAYRDSHIGFRAVLPPGQ